MRKVIVWLLVLWALACSPEPAMPVANGWLKIHDDLAFALIKESKLSEEPPLDRYEVRQIEEPLAQGQLLKIRLVTKVLDETERAALVRSPEAIGQVWPNSLELVKTELVSHVTDRAWAATDYDPSGLAHEDFEGGHSTYRTPATVTLNVAFVYKGTLVVVHASVEFDESAPDASAAERIEHWSPTLERVLRRLQRRA